MPSLVVDDAPLAQAVRGAVSAELSEIFSGSEGLRRMIRQEVTAALRAWSGPPAECKGPSAERNRPAAECNRPAAERTNADLSLRGAGNANIREVDIMVERACEEVLAGLHQPVPPRLALIHAAAPGTTSTNEELGRPRGQAGRVEFDTQSEGSSGGDDRAFEQKHFKSLIRAPGPQSPPTGVASSGALHDFGLDDAAPLVMRMSSHMSSCLDCLSELCGGKEPRGRLARCLYEFEHSSPFEGLVRFTIVSDVVCMGVAANYGVQNMGAPHPNIKWLENVFLGFYTFELLLKLIVHRLCFFRNEEDGSLNSLDFMLVALGWFDWFAFQEFPAGVFRSVRILRIGKAFRAFKVFSQFDRLRAFATCLKRSFGTLFWCMMMLFVVFYMFTLIFLQLVGLHLSNPEVTIDEEDRATIADFYGSFWGSMLTLWMAVSGGDDWGNAYNAIKLTGATGALIFILFICFTTVALMNLIMGFFVEGAMEVLSKSSEQAALDHEEQQRAYRRDLERLCVDMDVEQTGALGREQFQRGIQEGHMPRLMTLLGLHKDHVQRLFDALSYGSAMDEVDIGEFVSGCMSLRGAAQQFDFQVMFMEMRRMYRKSQRSLGDISGRIRTLEADRGITLE